MTGYSYDGVSDERTEGSHLIEEADAVAFRTIASGETLTDQIDRTDAEQDDSASSDYESQTPASAPQIDSEKDYQYDESESYADNETVTAAITATASYGFQTPYFAARNAQSAIDMPQFVSAKASSAQERPEYGNDWNEWSYPAWYNITGDRGPVSIARIAEIFGNLRIKFGFQRDNMFNMFDHLMTQLDSRASRMGVAMALTTIHADYIGGFNANYRRWYLAAQMDMDDDLGWSKVDNAGHVIDKDNVISQLIFKQREREKRNNDEKEAETSTSEESRKMKSYETIQDKLNFSLSAAENRYKTRMLNLEDDIRVQQVALYLCVGVKQIKSALSPRDCVSFINVPGIIGFLSHMTSLKMLKMDNIWIPLLRLYTDFAEIKFMSG